GLDIILITGDAYVDHPSYGTSLIGRLLESHGYKVGIIAQPDWHNTNDFKKLGKPRLFFGITSGNTDSLIANYTASKRSRREDKYSPGDRTGLRPDRAVIVYANRVREEFKDTPIVLGGMEASMRRLTHYDYWDDRVRHSILIDSRADILVYGMGEKQILEITERLNSGEPISSLNNIRGTAIVRGDISFTKEPVMLPSFGDVEKSKEKFNKAFVLAYGEMDPYNGKTVIQKDGTRYIVQLAPALPLSPEELDKVYGLPYARNWHPVYKKEGGVRGFETVKFSITSHRGCVGECSFCSLYFHQGKIVQSRSLRSILEEAKIIADDPDFKGTITDIGGPTANLYAARCALQQKGIACSEKKCLLPGKCKNFELGYDKCIEVYRRVSEIPKVKNVFIGSGFRYDLLVDDYADKYLKEICARQVSGLMKIAPEHCSNNVLKLMNKPTFDVYEKFVEKFQKTARELKKNIFIVNYFIASHPGSSLEEALKLALYLAKRRIKPEQIQDFIPSPMTLSTCMYYTESEPFTGKKVYSAKTAHERTIQRALMQYNKPENAKFVREALGKLGRMHVLRKLIPFGNGQGNARRLR
ncbi:MAG: YgiQ family radical SAM protein, partial [Candidatus Omnitrophica bacterium]|nr:YgiQ family radical SAM protein [Candidatus Omnitrophota bacterium]